MGNLSDTNSIEHLLNVVANTRSGCIVFIQLSNLITSAKPTLNFA